MSEVACFCDSSRLFTSLEKDSYRFFKSLPWAWPTDESACSVLSSWVTYLSTSLDVFAVLFPSSADCLNVSPTAPTRAAANVTAKLQNAVINSLRIGLCVTTILLLLSNIFVRQLLPITSAPHRACGRCPYGRGGILSSETGPPRLTARWRQPSESNPLALS